MEIQREYFASVLNTQSLGVILQECSVSLGIHVSHHAAGMPFRHSVSVSCKKEIKTGQKRVFEWQLHNCICD